MAGDSARAPAAIEAGVGFAAARALEITFDHPLDPEALESLFLAPPACGELLRAKGICVFEGWPPRSDGSDRWTFQWADDRLEIGPLAQPPGKNPAVCVAVIIGVGLDASAWNASLRNLERPPQGARRKRSLNPRG